MQRAKGPVAADVVRKEWNSFKRGSPGRRMKSLQQINAMLADERLTDNSDDSCASDLSADEESYTLQMSPPAPSSNAQERRTLRQNVNMPRPEPKSHCTKTISEVQAHSAVSSNLSKPSLSKQFLSMRPGTELPEEVIRAAVADVIHRNSRDVTMRSLRLQLQNALGADFSGKHAGNLLKKLVAEEQEGPSSDAKQKSFLEELKELKAKRDKEKSATAKQGLSIDPRAQNRKPDQGTGRVAEALAKHQQNNSCSKEQPSPKPVLHRHQHQASSYTYEDDFARRQRLGLLTNAELLQLRERSALHSQRLVRGFLGRRRASKLALKKMLALEKAREEERAAMIAAENKKAAMKKALEIARAKCANDIQRVFRAWTQRKYFLELRHRRKKCCSANRIQSCWRGSRGRRIAFAARLDRRRERCCTTIQTAVRRKVAYTDLARRRSEAEARKHASASCLQNLVRRFLAVKRARHLREEKRKLEESRNENLLLNKAACRIQNYVRIFQHEQQLKRREVAVVKIQSMVRRLKLRERVSLRKHRKRQKQRMSLLKIQKWLRKALAINAEKRSRAAKTIQVQARCVSAQRLYNNQRNGAIRIQSLFRGWSSRSKICPESDKTNGAPACSTANSGKHYLNVPCEINHAADSSPALPVEQPQVAKPMRPLRQPIGSIRTSGWTEKDESILDGLHRLKRRRMHMPQLVCSRKHSLDARRSHNSNQRGGFSSAGKIPVRVKAREGPSDDGEGSKQARTSSGGDLPIRQKTAKRGECFLPPVTQNVGKRNEAGDKPAWNSLFGVQQQYESNRISVRNRILRGQYARNR